MKTRVDHTVPLFAKEQGKSYGGKEGGREGRERGEENEEGRGKLENGGDMGEGLRKIVWREEW